MTMIMDMTEVSFQLFDDTQELREILLTAEWEEYIKDYESQTYLFELEDEEYYMVVYSDGSIEITDDLAIALGEIDDYVDDDEDTEI